MNHIITDEDIEYISILSKLELSDNEKERAKIDIDNLLDFMDVIDSVDTRKINKMAGYEDGKNVFREDEITNVVNDGIIRNAPSVKCGMYEVPKTI